MNCVGGVEPTHARNVRPSQATAPHFIAEVVMMKRREEEEEHDDGRDQVYRMGGHNAQ